jgi:hypothetical protein
VLKRLLLAAIPLIAVLVVPVGLIAGTARAASAADTTAGTCGSAVGIITPPANGTGGINTSPGINGAPGINTAPGLNGSPALPQGAMILTPTRGTGALVVPVPAATAGASAPRYQIIVPGPNPAQNTSVALSQLLSALLSPPGGITPVAVYPIPGSPPHSTP